MELTLSFQFPPWPPSRLVSEAVNEFNLLHVDTPLDETSEWSALCDATVCFLRHRFSNYDDIVCEDNREPLRAQILATARAHYPWLRPEKPPARITRAKTSQWEKRPGERYLDYLSRVSGEFHSERNLLDLALKQNPDASTRAELRAQRAQIERTLAMLYQDCTHDLGKFDPDYQGLRWIVRLDHIEGSYNLDGCGEYRLERTGVRCPRCSQAVLRSKTEVPVGQGRRMLLVSCHCISLLISKGNRNGLRFCPTQEGWEKEVADVYGAPHMPALA